MSIQTWSACRRPLAKPDVGQAETSTQCLVNVRPACQISEGGGGDYTVFFDVHWLRPIRDGPSEV